MKRWRAAVIGGGFIGRVHAEALHRLPQAELTALCDPEGAQQKAEAWNVPHAYADYRELVEQERPEVYISARPTPPITRSQNLRWSTARTYCAKSPLFYTCGRRRS